MDVFGFRVVVADVPMQCYHALGAVHALYKPLDARFRDFIAIPKANGYQSLHTVLFGPYGSPIEVQIRTEDMDLIAERGIAAHWSYKTRRQPREQRAERARSSGSRSLIESQRATGSSLEFLENVKVDLFPDEVYLFTPKGDILSLPRNATALDFAYAVHTDVGNHAVAARVDKKLVPLRTQAGQRPDAWRSSPRKSASPKPQWLEFVVTGKARTAIRHYLKQPASTRTRCNSATACSTARWRTLDSSLDRMPQRAAGRVPRRAPLSAAGGAAGRHRARQPHAGAGGAGADARHVEPRLPATSRPLQPARRS